MKGIKYILLVLFLLMTVNVKGIELKECTDDELNRLKKIANNVELTYEYKLKDAGVGTSQIPEFYVVASNLNEDIRVLIIRDFLSQDFDEFKYNNTKQAKLGPYLSGEKVTVTIKGYVENRCSGKTVGTKSIRLPYYNNAHNTDFCKKYPDFKYCVEFSETSISYDTFVSESNKFIDAKEQEKQTEEIKQEEPKSNIYYIIGISLGIIILLVIVFVLLIRKKRREAL